MKLNYLLWFKVKIALGTLVALWGFILLFTEGPSSGGQRLLIIAGLSYLFSIGYLLFRIHVDKQLGKKAGN